MTKLRHAFLAAALAAASCGPALAQGAAGPEAEAGLSEQYSDWTVRCAAAGGGVVCAMAQDVRATAGGAPLVSARVDMMGGADPRLTLIVPLGLDLEAGIALYPGTARDPLASFLPRLCQSEGCYAFVPLTPALLDGLGQVIALRVAMTPFNAEITEVPLSLRGFDDALARLRALHG